MNPFGSRRITRLLIFCGVGILGMPIFIGPFVAIALPFYFMHKTKKGATACSDIIKKQFGENVEYIEEVHHPKKEWGYLALTEKSVIFIPKAGDEIIVPLTDIKQYGCNTLGTGEFITTVTQIPGSRMNVGSTRENRVPVFYFEQYDGNFQYWYVNKIDPFFKALKGSIGKKTEEMKVNY